MKHFVFFLNRLATNRYVALFSGMMVIGVAAHDLQRIRHDAGADKSGYLALFVLGFMMIVRALSEIFETLEYIEEVAQQGPADRLGRALRLLFHKIVASPIFELCAAVFVLLAGFFHAYSILKSRQMAPMWPFAIVLLGFSLVIRSLSSLTLTIGYAEQALTGLGRCVPAVRKVNRVLSNPFMEITVAVFLVAFIFWDELGRSSSAEEMMIGGYFGILIVALIRIGQFLPDIFKSIKFLAAAEK